MTSGRDVTTICAVAECVCSYVSCSSCRIKDVVPFDYLYMCVFKDIPVVGIHGFLFVSRMSFQSF